MVNRDVLAIVPAFNEEHNVGAVVREIRDQAPFAEVLVVDDGSTDATREKAIAAGAMVLSHPSNTGIGAAVRTGMSFALERGYRVAVQVDGDGQHVPAYMHRLLAPVLAGKADVCVGSRFLLDGGYRPPWYRRVGTLLLSAAVGLVTGKRASDTTSGFRAMNRRAMEFLVCNYPDDYPESESLVLLHLAGLVWEETGVRMRKRPSGRSSISAPGSIYYMIKVTACIAMDAARVKVPTTAAAGGRR